MELCDDDDDFVSRSNHAQREWDKMAENYTNVSHRVFLCEIASDEIPR